VPLQIDFTEYQ